jgi:hypothetical protein
MQRDGPPSDGFIVELLWEWSEYLKEKCRPPKPRPSEPKKPHNPLDNLKKKKGSD